MFRSLLFIPGNNPSMIQNADIFMADGVIFDLEDSVDINEKDNARNLIHNYLVDSTSYPSLIVLRVNPVDTSFFEKDIKLILTGKIDFLLLPKTDINSLDIITKELSKLEKENKLDKVNIIALAESSKSIIEINQIAEHERVNAILLGAEDLCNDLEISRTNEGNEILFARSKVIYACASNNIISIDTPNTDISDEDKLIEDCKIAKSLGMKAKTAIHPSQLEIINEIFSPANDEIIWAKAVLELKEINVGKGAFSYKGKMIDKPLILKAEKIIEKAKKFNLI